MAKKKKVSKEAIHKENCRLSYDIVAPMLDLNNTIDAKEQLREIVFGANSILTEICKNADKIKIDLLECVQETTPVESKQWVEFVQLATTMAKGEVSQKKLEKMNESFENSMFIVSLRKSFIDTYVNGDGSEIQLPVKEQDIPLPNLPETESEPDFEKFLQQAVQIRTYINTVLWPAFRQFAEAAEHITDGRIKYYEFKDLVDWEHYKEGGYPSENSKPKLWSIIDRFNYASRLMLEFEFPQIQELFKQFGMDVTLSAPHPSKDTFTDSARALSNFDIYKPKDDATRIELKMLEDEHILHLTLDNFLIYDIETRVIRRAMFYAPSQLNELVTSTNIKESFEWLCFDDKSEELRDTLLSVYPKISTILHPSGKLSTSRRLLDKDEFEILGEGGYYGKDIKTN